MLERALFALVIASFGAGCAQPRGSCETPIVLSFDGEPPTLLSGLAEPVFDLEQGSGLTSDWPTSKTPWLARDVNGNGEIDDGAELFGSSTKLANGEQATNGFDALAELDTNGDGVLDATWDELLVWRDRDDDRRSEPDELESVRAAGIVRIQVAGAAPPAVAKGAPPQCDRDHNCDIMQGAFGYVAADGQTKTGAAIDVDLALYPVAIGADLSSESCD